jgi:SSS family solute:Na+ symporter
MRLAIVVGLLVSVTLAYTVRDEYVIARFTAIFFGLCAATFMPAYIGGLFSKRITRAGAVASMLVGCSPPCSGCCSSRRRRRGPSAWSSGSPGARAAWWRNPLNWPSVDPIVVALPLSILTAILVSALTRRRTPPTWPAASPRNPTEVIPCWASTTP